MTTRSDLSLIAMSVCLLATSTACRSEAGKSAADSNAAAAAPAPGGAAPANTGQHAMAGGMSGMHEDTLAARVQAHVQRLSTNNPDSLKALVPADRDVVNSLIADCEKMMREMKMTPPRKWNSAVADLRADLGRLPTLSGAALQTAMADHRKRIEDMLSMRRDMMKM